MKQALISCCIIFAVILGICFTIVKLTSNSKKDSTSVQLVPGTIETAAERRENTAIYPNSAEAAALRAATTRASAATRTSETTRRSATSRVSDSGDGSTSTNDAVTSSFDAADAPTTTAAQPALGPNADLHGYRFFPANDAWNQDISKSPVDPASRTILTAIGLNRPVHPDFGTTVNGGPNGIPYIVVDKNQKLVPVTFTSYADESDKGPYPIPLDAPIEAGPDGTGDRHVLALDRDNNKLYELFNAFPTPDGWKAESGAIFDVTKPSLQRPVGWTSADAAGMAVVPGLVRYDEVHELHKINHALRFTVQHSREAYIPPANHWASNKTDPHLPPMGMRLRLRADFNTAGYSPQNQVILQALKTYGMILADNGSDFYISGAPDPRWNDDDLHHLTLVKGSDFEVIKMTGMVLPKSRK